MFFHEVALGPELEEFLYTFGFVPARYSYLTAVAPSAMAARFGPMLSAMFLHGGLLHLVGNMWTLWIFGDNVEDRLGRGRYLVYYVACGLAAAYFHYWMDPLSHVPAIGASGAIAGVKVGGDVGRKRAPERGAMIPARRLAEQAAAADAQKDARRRAAGR